MAMEAPTMFMGRADAEFDFVLVATDPGKVRAETLDGLAIHSYGTRLTEMSGQAPNVRARMRTYYPNASEVALGKRLRAVKKREDAAPRLIWPALPVDTQFRPKPQERTPHEMYGEPWDQIHPMFRPLLTRDVDSTFDSVRKRLRGLR